MGRLEKLDKMLAGEGKVADANLGILLSEFSCLDAFLGVDYEIFDTKGKLMARIRRKALAPEQTRELMVVLEAMMKKTKGRRKGGA